MVAKIRGKIKPGAGGNEPRFPAWGARAARRRNGPFERFRICCSRGGAGVVFPWLALPGPDAISRIGSVNGPDASARRLNLWGGKRDDEEG